MMMMMMIYIYIYIYKSFREIMLDCRVVVRELKFLLAITFTFTQIPLETVWILYPRSYRLNHITTALLQNYFWHWTTHEGWYSIKKTKDGKKKHRNRGKIDNLQICVKNNKLKKLLRSGNMNIQYTLFSDNYSYNIFRQIDQHRFKIKHHPHSIIFLKCDNVSDRLKK